MALKKGFFKGLQGGVNHSPLRMHDGTKNTGPSHSKKTVNIQQQVNNDQLQYDNNTLDPKSWEYRQLYNEGSIHNPSLDEVVIDGRVDYDKFPYYDDLNKQEKEIFHNDQSPIGDAVRRRGYTKKGLAEDTTDMVTNMLVKQPLSALQVPQSLLVEGIEALRGNDYNFANAITNDTQRLPSETIGFEDKQGWDLGGSLNTIMDVVADPSNITGAGLGVKGLKALNKVKNIPKSLTNFANNIGKNTDNAVSNALGNNIDDAGVDAFQQAINAQRGTKNVDYNLDNVGGIGDFSFDFSKLPQRTSENNYLVDAINRKLLGSDKELGRSLEPLARELRKGANTFRKTREFASNNMRSEQGQQRLTDLITETLDSKTEIPFSLNPFKDKEVVANMSTKTREKYINYFKKQHQDKLSKSKSMNELVDELAFDSKGNYSPNGAVKAIYGEGNKIYSNLVDNAYYNGLNRGQNPSYVLGTGTTGASSTAYHELLGHGGQYIDKLNKIGDVSNADNRLRNLSQRSAANSTPDQGYFNTGSKGKEPYAYAQELKKSMHDLGILKNNNGTWETVTPEMLKKTRDILTKSPKGYISGPADGRFFNEARALDFVEDLDGLSTEMNKLIGANNPGDTDGKNKFDLLKANSMEANA